jgi:hypothetical protein
MFMRIIQQTNKSLSHLDGTGEVLTTLSSSENYVIESNIAKAIVTLRAVHSCCALSFYRTIAT